MNQSSKPFKPLKGECPLCETMMETEKPQRYRIYESYTRCPECDTYLHVIATHWKVRFSQTVPR